MNPLDKEELSEILKIIKNDMPLHTDKTAKIKRTQYQRFPKSLMEESIKVNNKFLNNNLAIIEEINYKDSKHWIPKAFQEYQNNIYKDKEILNHDNFFKAKLHDSFFKYQDEYGMPKNTHYMKGNSIQNVGFLGSLTSKALGATLETGDTSVYSTFASHWYATGVTGAVANTFYDQVALNIFNKSTSTLYRMAVYSNSSSLPDTLYNQTASTTYPTSGYTFIPLIAEIEITQTVLWIAQQTNGGGNAYMKTDTGTYREAYYASQAYNTFTSPWTNAGREDSLWNVKIAHT